MGVPLKKMTGVANGSQSNWLMDVGSFFMVHPDDPVPLQSVEACTMKDYCHLTTRQLYYCGFLNGAQNNSGKPVRRQIVLTNAYLHIPSRKQSARDASFGLTKP